LGAACVAKVATGHFSEALTTARGIEDEFDRARALAEIAAHLPD
jgi:hypothetical protein